MSLRNLDQEGISGIDYAIKVFDLCSFENNGMGIRGNSTISIPFRFDIGEEEIDGGNFKYRRNIFQGNKSFDVNLNASYASPGIVNVTRNDFTSVDKGGVSVYPNCRVDVKNNTFSGHIWGISVRDNGLKPNNIRCNVFDGVRFGTMAIGNNERTVFLENDYLNMIAGGAETRLAKTSGSPLAPKAKIFSNQGGTNNPADNCFDTNAGTDFLAPIANAEHFFYFYVNTAQPGSCMIPTVGNNNYTINPTPNESDLLCYYASPNELAGEPPYSKGQYANIRNNANAALSDWQSNPADLSKGAHYYRLLQAKVYVMDWLLQFYQTTNQYTEAETLLMEENTQPARQELLGLKASREDWSGMATVLASYPVNSQDDAWFVQVQQINLQRLSATQVFHLSASQESLLYQVALSVSPVRGYARGLIALLKGEYIMDEDPEDEIGLPEERSLEVLKPLYNLFPNPADEVLTLEYPNTHLFAEIQLLDLFGNPVLRQQLDNSGNFRFSTASLPTGIYILKYVADGILCHTAKLVVTH